MNPWVRDSGIGPVVRLHPEPLSLLPSGMADATSLLPAAIPAPVFASSLGSFAGDASDFAARAAATTQRVVTQLRALGKPPIFDWLAGDYYDRVRPLTTDFANLIDEFIALQQAGTFSQADAQSILANLQGAKGAIDQIVIQRSEASWSGALNTLTGLAWTVTETGKRTGQAVASAVGGGWLKYAIPLAIGLAIFSRLGR